MTALLPAAFADLEGYAPTWCLATESERYDQRMAIVRGYASTAGFAKDQVNRAK